MKCPNCGVELPSDARFCGSCGANLSLVQAPVNETPVMSAEPIYPDSPVADYPDAPVYAEPQPSKVKLAMASLGAKLKPLVEKCKPFVQKNKLLLAGAGCVAILLITILIVVSALTAGNGFTPYAHSIQVGANDGEIILMYDNKKVIKTGIEADSIYSTQSSLDGNVQVARTDDGKLIVVKGKKATVVAEDVTKFVLSTTGKGIAFVTENDEGEETLKLLKVGKKKATTVSDDFRGSFYLSPDGKSLAYFKYDEENSNSELMYFTGSKSKKVTSSEVSLVGLSNGGKQIYVTAKNEDGETVLYSYNTKGDKKKIGVCSNDSFYFNEDHTQILYFDAKLSLSEGADYRSYISTKGKEGVKIATGKAYLLIPDSSAPHSRGGIITYPTKNLFNKVYRCYKDNQSNLWLIKKNVDNSKRLANNVSSVTLDEEAKFAYYMDKDGDLNVLKISHGERAADKAKLIAEDVKNYVVTSDREKVYFISEDALYSVNGKTGKGKKTVASENVGSALALNQKDICYYSVDGDVYASSNGKKGKMVIAEGSIMERTANGIVYFITEDAIFATKTAKKPTKIFSQD